MNGSDPLLPAERQQRVLDLLKGELTVRSSRLSNLLGVSEMTIRRDLDTLEMQGLVERTHGGALFKQEPMVGKFRYDVSILENPGEKKRIAKKAASMIQPNDTVYIGGGTTCSQVIRHVDPGMPFTVFTNNLGVISEIGDKVVNLVMLGGAYAPETRTLSGPLTIEMIQLVTASRVFLGADALSLSAGLTTTDIDIAAIERAMINRTRGEVIVMTDQSKFGTVAEMLITSMNNIDVLVTEGEIPSDFQKDLESMKIRVLLA